MKQPKFTLFMTWIAIAGTVAVERASAEESEAFPRDVSCQLSLDASPSPGNISIDELSRSCNQFRVQNEKEFNFVKRACTLGGRLSGMLYAFNEGLCKSEKAAALCRVPIQNTELEEVTWYFLPNSAKNDPNSSEQKFRDSCSQLGGKYEKLS
ncbi:hypothetical protein EBR21_18040 [bacterium]|nr:hypothetical protein [bacterium]